jgi:peroxiredoxin
MRSFIFASLLFPCLCSAAEPLPGHSVHGEAFDEGPRQAAVLMKGCGEVRLAVSTKSAEAQKFFNQGVGQLHGFWYFEAERSFRQVAALDPECAMAYWGCAMANVNNEKRAAGFVAEAAKRKAGASKREQEWISSLESFYKDLKKDKKARHMDFIKDLEEIVHDNPDELEAKAFLAWAIWHAKEAGVPMVSRESVSALLREVFAKAPMHPAHHYVIHLWDDSKPARALESAAHCGQTSPAIAHMWHMPGHTFSKLDRQEDAAWQQEAATRVDHAYMIGARILPDQIHNYAHNTEWLIRTLNQLGRAREAINIARNLIEIPRHPTWNSIEKQSNSAAFGRTRLIETLLKFERWEELLSLEKSPYLDTTQNPTYEANRMRAMGIAAFFTGDVPRLHGQIEALSKLRAEREKEDAKKAAEEAAKRAEKKPDSAKKEDSKPEPKKAETKRKPNPQIAHALAELKAIEAIQKEEDESAIKLLAEASDTPKDRLARYQLKLGHKDKAAALAKELPDDAPSQALKVEILLRCDQKDEAKKSFNALRKTASALDNDLPISARLEELAVKFGYPRNWRIKDAPRKDSGERPSLDSLGPLHWHPFQALPFELADAEGKMHRLSEHAGTPVVVLFYLGHGCDHCLAQLKEFSAVAADFKSAGINILAIGTEDAKGLVETAKVCNPSGSIPFPVLADPDAKVFHQWHCFDDFEKMALHGAFLVDGHGDIRWLDISYEPFRDAKFLLGEAKRLLSLQK